MPATQSCGEYVTSIFPPVSVLTVLMRHQFMAGDSSTVSTRLGIRTPTNETSGSVTLVPPTRPVCEIRSSHRPARVPSPGSGNVWVSVQDSTSRYAAGVAAEFQTRVVTFVSRLVVQNVGAPTRQGSGPRW